VKAVFKLHQSSPDCCKVIAGRGLSCGRASRKDKECKQF